MKNKALTYVLMIIVGLVWYKVFFRLRNNFDESSQQPNTTELKQKPIDDLMRDTFLLKANYDDPFYEFTNVVEVPKSQERDIVKKQLKPKVTTQEIWPKMHYYGIVKKTDSKNPLAIINVDGVRFMVRSGNELYNDIFISRIWRDSVKIGMKKKFIILPRSRAMN